MSRLAFLRVAIVAVSVALSSSITWALWPEPRLDPSIAFAQIAGRYVARSGYFTYEPNSRFLIADEHGVSIEVDSDEEGLRNPVGSLESSRTILLGDSFAAGVNTPRERTFASLLSAYNAGIDGFSTFQEARLLRHLLTRSRPSVVVLAFYLGNDFRDNFLDRARQSDVHWMGSYVTSEAASYMPGKPLPEIRASPARTGEALAELVRICQERGIRLLVVGVPSVSQVFQSLAEREAFARRRATKEELSDFEQVTSAVKNFDFDAPDFRLRTILSAGNVEYVSLLGPFRGRRDRGSLFGDLDYHWTTRGQAIAAEIVSRSIFDEGPRSP